jgi:hypothetical protein
VQCDLYTRERGDVSSSSHKGGPWSNWTNALVFIHSNVFFKHGYFEEGATALSHWKGATLIRVKDMEFGNETPTDCLNYVNTFIYVSNFLQCVLSLSISPHKPESLNIS